MNDATVADPHPWGPRHDLHGLFRKYNHCIVRVQVELPTGGIGNGTAFHIGGGAFATAAHVVRGYANPTLFQGDSTYGQDANWPVTNILFHPDPNVDVAIVLSDLWRKNAVKHTNTPRADEELATHIEIPEMWGEWIEDSLVLTRGVICGYPTVPMADSAYKIAVSAEINSDIQRYDVPGVHFIVSSTARGGFSGAPFISEFGMLLGIVTAALFEHGNESPYMAVVAIEALYPLLDREDALRGRLEHHLAEWSDLQKDLHARLEKTRKDRKLTMHGDTQT